MTREKQRPTEPSDNESLTIKFEREHLVMKMYLEGSKTIGSVRRVSGN